MRKRFLSVAGLVAGILLATGAAATAAPLPTGASTLTGTVNVAASDGTTAQTFTGAEYTFTPVDDAGTYGTNDVIIVDVELPQGVTLTAGSFGTSTCDTTNGSVTVAGSEAHVEGVSCAAGETIVVDVDGSSLVVTEGTYDVTAQYKRWAPRRLHPRGIGSPNMWQVTDIGGFTVGSVCAAGPAACSS
jgi:hypothetical protein